jgi:hypothetical protein
MTDRGSGHRFLVKTFGERRIVTDKFGFDYLDGASGFQKSVVGFINDSHPTFAEAALEHILTFERDISGQRVESRSPIDRTLGDRVVVTRRALGAFSHGSQESCAQLIYLSKGTKNFARQGMRQWCDAIEVRA